MSLEVVEEFLVRTWEVCGMDGEEFRDIELEVENESEEARVFRDPGAPTEIEIEQHNVTHLSFRAWCRSCVEGKARDRPHRRQDVEEKSLAEVVFDCDCRDPGRQRYANEDDVCSCGSPKRSDP